MHATTLIAATAAVALLSTSAAAQQSPAQGQPQQRPQQQAQQGQGQGQQLSEQQIRQFFQQADQAITQAVQQNDMQQGLQFLQQHLADNAGIWSNKAVYFGDQLVATNMTMMTRDQLQRVAQFAMAAGDHQMMVQNYNLDIQVQDIEMLPGGAARVMAVFNETGTLMPSGQGGQSGASASGQQIPTQSTQTSGAQQTGGGTGPQSGQQARQQQRQGAAGGQGGQSAQYTSTMTCMHILSTGQGGMIEIGQSACNGETRFGS